MQPRKAIPCALVTMLTVSSLASVSAHAPLDIQVRPGEDTRGALSGSPLPTAQRVS